MPIRPVSMTNNNSGIKLKRNNPSFKMRDIYFGWPRETILKETVNKFKNEAGITGKRQNITNHILTKYFGWHSPSKMENPDNRGINIALGLGTLGMYTFMSYAKKESDREDAGELASIVIDRIVGSR